MDYCLLTLDSIRTSSLFQSFSGLTFVLVGVGWRVGVLLRSNRGTRLQSFSTFSGCSNIEGERYVDFEPSIQRFSRIRTLRGQSLFETPCTGFSRHTWISHGSNWRRLCKLHDPSEVDSKTERPYAISVFSFPFSDQLASATIRASAYMYSPAHQILILRSRKRPGKC